MVCITSERHFLNEDQIDCLSFESGRSFILYIVMANSLIQIVFVYIFELEMTEHIAECYYLYIN